MRFSRKVIYRHVYGGLGWSRSSRIPVCDGLHQLMNPGDIQWIGSNQDAPEPSHPIYHASNSVSEIMRKGCTVTNPLQLGIRSNPNHACFRRFIALCCHGLSRSPDLFGRILISSDYGVPNHLQFERVIFDIGDLHALRSMDLFLVGVGVLSVRHILTERTTFVEQISSTPTTICSFARR